MKRIGPELKMPKLKGSSVKAPPFLTDLYYDLRDRRLLPLVALILVAIAAAPFLLKSDGEEVEPAPAPGLEAGVQQTSEKTLTVVKAAPGLRNYKKRLKRRQPTDPFVQRYTAPSIKGGELNEPSTTTTTTTTEGGPGKTDSTGSTQPVPSGGSPSGGSDSNGDEIPDGVSLYTYTLDLQITKIQTKPSGGKEKTGPTVHKDVKAPSPLPGEKSPVVTYLGMGAKEPRLPMFLVSSEVTAIYGEGVCVSGTSTCQLISLRKGFPVTFVYGPNSVRYKINLLDVTPVPIRAPQQ